MPSGIGTRSVPATLGISGRTGGVNAQCALYSAPSAIQRRSKSFSAAVNSFFDLAGGIRSSVAGKNPPHQLALLRLAGNDRFLAAVAPFQRRIAFVEPQAPFAMLGVPAVAGKTLVSQKRPDLPLEIDLLDLLRCVRPAFQAAGQPR